MGANLVARRTTTLIAATLGFDSGSRGHAASMDLPKTISPKKKTAKEMNNAENKTKTKLHQFIHKIFSEITESVANVLRNDSFAKQLLAICIAA